MPAEDHTYRQAIYLAKNYFLESPDRKKALYLFFGTALTVIATSVLSLGFIFWFQGFYAALMAENVALLISSLKLFGGLGLASVCLHTLKSYLMKTLKIRWQKWMTDNYIKNFIADYDVERSNYLNLMREKKMDTPGQRLQEIPSYVKATLRMTFGILDGIVKLSAFTATLWVLGGALSFSVAGMMITIPGYLVWTALGVSLFGSFVADKITRKLDGINQDKKQKKAAFRETMASLAHQSESVGQENGERYYRGILQENVNNIQDISKNKRSIGKKLTAFNSGYTYALMIFPYLAAIPLFLMGLTDVAHLTQIVYAFEHIGRALHSLFSSYGKLSNYSVTTRRIFDLQQGLTLKKNHTPKGITVEENDTIHAVQVKNLTLATPKLPPSSVTGESSTKVIFKGLNLEIKAGENTLITGASGLGKSTLLKVFSKTWPYGSGEVVVPSKTQCCFFAQTPTIPTDSLKAVLAYPHPVTTYSDEAYKKVLRTVGGGMEELIPHLKEVHPWATILSGGQKQRIAFARALLAKPQWLFLDEITASLDEESEADLYMRIKEELPNTTFISVAHRSSVIPFHERVIKLYTKSKENREVEVFETFRRTSN